MMQNGAVLPNGDVYNECCSRPHGLQQPASPLDVGIGYKDSITLVRIILMVSIFRLGPILET